jgi:carbon-monoxide dehydrogenase large subunit
MKITDDVPSGLSALDRPNSYIGRSVPRPNLARLTQGRAQFVSDLTLPRMAHVAFVRSPHAHARITAIATAAARKAPGVIAVVTGADLAKVITPWVGVLLAGRGGLRHRGAQPRRGRGRLRAGRSRLRGAARRH